ncbi:MAG: TetR/AcrR family transcriptional regulator [Deltaproteobacteria bacterium]|nr:TetR/AcrR family transcriptional regulator [Deltaproteobacteria bacterium]
MTLPVNENSPSTTLPRRSEARRREILEVAALLFAERGFEKTSIKALAAEAQVSTSTIYTYFADKSDLLEQVVRSRLDALLGGLLADVDAVDDPLDALLIGARHLHARLSADPMLGRILTFEPHVVGRGVRQYARSVVERINQVSTELIRRAVARGEFECADPEALNALMRCAMQGWMLNSQRGHEPVPEPRMTEALLDLIRRAARPRS